MIRDVRELTVRMRGEDVAELQRRLLDLGYELPEPEVRRHYFGTATRNAIEDIQLHHQIDVTGVVNAVTGETIASALHGVPRRPLLRLVDAGTGLPLAGVTVRVRVPGSDVHETATSGADGSVSLRDARTNGNGGQPLEGSAEVEVLRADGQPIETTQVTVDAREAGIPELQVAAARPASQPIESFAGSLDITLPAALLARLRRRQIHSLDDLRSAGRLRGADDGQDALGLLQAHAGLSVLPTDPAVNAQLIEAGYRSVLEIARAPREDFVNALSARIGADTAGLVHDAASAERAFLGNAATGARVGGAPVASASDAINAATGETCACKDCMSALGPLAYLADLLDYSIDHLRKTPGLRGSYFAETTFNDLRVTRTDPTLDFAWDKGSPDPLLSPGRFAVRWTGQIEPQFSETYTFQAVADGGIRMWIGNQLVINDWQEHGRATSTGTSALTAGRRYDIKVEYFDTDGAAVAELSWSSASQPLEIIPQERLWPDRSGLEINLSLLETLLSQPLSRLPAACALVDEQLRQVRGCIEVLRAYVAANPLTPAAANLLQDGERDYVMSSYLTLLEQIGTSYEELSEARGAKRADRAALATRLGIDPQPQRPDELDQLVLDPTTVTEDELETLFGLRDTRRDPLDPTPAGAILEWRRQHLRNAWKQADWPANPPAGAGPLIDPDLIGPDDFASVTSAASTRWQQRQAWVKSRMDEKLNVYAASGLEFVLTGPPEPARTIQNAQPGVVWLGISFADIGAIQADIDARKNVDGQLTPLGLTLESFAQISGLVALFQSGATLLEPELSNVFSILVELEKEEMFDDWRRDEKQAGITLSPDYFRLRPASVDGGGDQPDLNPWRTSVADRRRWERTLQARIAQEQALEDGIADAIDAAETAPTGLTRLRDGLVLAVAPSVGDPEARADWVTRRLFIDARAGICQMTTRVALAIEALQGILFAARNGLLEDNFLTLDATDFDDEWRWIGSYAGWRAAMLTFLYPETMLRPTLRRQRSAAFDALVTAFRDQGPATVDLADRHAAAYSDYFADVCSLSFAALTRVSAPPEISAGAAGEALFLIVARGGKTGKLYYCTQDASPDWWRTGGFTRSLWNAIPKLDVSAEVDSLFPYQASDGKTRAGLYYSSGAAGSRAVKFTSFDGSVWSAPAGAEDPVLVTSARVDSGMLPATAALVATGVTGWNLSASDRVALADIDGDGRKELVLVAGNISADGTRAVGFARERTGGLVLDAVGSIAEDWDLPPGQTPVVLRTVLVRSPSHYRERLLVLDANNRNLGLLGINATNGQPAVVGATTNGTVTGAAGRPPWIIHLSAKFVSADLDADGLSELVAVDAPVQGNPVGYLGVWAFTVRENGFTGLHDIPLDSATTPVVEAVAVRDSERAVGDAVVVLHSARQLQTRDQMLIAKVKWDPSRAALEDAAASGSATIEKGAPTLDNDDPSVDPNGWVFRKQDEVLAFEWDAAAQGTELLLTSGTRQEIAVAVIGGDPPITFPQTPGHQFELLWRSAKRVEAMADGQGASWTRQPGDRFVAADLDGDGDQELAVISADNRRVGVLARTSDGKLEVAWSDPAVVAGPGGGTEPEWPLLAATTYLAGDIDGDGCAEIVAHVGDRVGVLRGRPPKRNAFDLGVRDSYGPSGVSARDVIPRLSPGWTADRPARIQEAYELNRGLSGLWVDDPDVPHLDEAYYFVPIELGDRLADAGEYEAALDWFSSVYDYSQPIASRKTAYKLRIEENVAFAFTRAPDWLSDPLNPHLIASTRAGSYTRYTILAIVTCMLGWADAEFTRATATSIPRARALYLAVLELLDAPELRLRDTRCQDLIDGVEIDVGSGEWQSLWNQIRDELSGITDYDLLQSVVNKIRTGNGESADIADRTARARKLVAKALARSKEAKTFAAVADNQVTGEDNVTEALLADPEVASATLLVGASAFRQVKPDRAFATTADRRMNGANGAARANGAAPAGQGAMAIDLMGGIYPATSGHYVPAPKFYFCVPPDANVDAVRQHAELNLLKIRSCRNIAGLQQRPDTYAGQDAAQPMPYRYGVLVDRAKQLVQLAQQIESSMLTAIEKGDEEAYRELRARQDLELARAGVRLKDLQVSEASSGVQLAAEQRDRAQIQQQHYAQLLDDGLTYWERAGIGALATAAALETAGLYSVETLIEFAGAGAKVASTAAQWFNQEASFERREQEWDLLNRLALQDMKIGEQQIQLARDHVSVTMQDRAIAVLQADNAEVGLEFLTRKFTNSDLYEWMSSVLEDVYRFFLQQATSMAGLAQAQLAFERQDVVPSFIQADYWEPPQDATDETQNTTDDRRGLTGSARLLRDLYQLDQYAFATDQRKLQLTKTLSLAQLDPYAFQRFRETGVLQFATPLELFDRDFPGHLLRLIKRVRTSVVALVPPTDGIKATLSTTGTSRVVIRSAGFPRVTIQRGPEAVAITSPVRATGLFDPDAQPDMLVPFEGIGVDAAWELRMPRAANRVDYSTIADVLLSIDYTALDSPDYRTQLMTTIDRTISAERVFSFRHMLQDQWFDLNNPDQTATPMKVGFTVTTADYPPNLLDDISIAAVSLYYVPASGVSTTGWDTALRTRLAYLPDKAPGSRDGSADPMDGLAGTRLARGSDWVKFVGELAVGEWVLTLPDTPATRGVFENGEIDDILFILTYTATTPPWPDD